MLVKVAAKLQIFLETAIIRSTIFSIWCSKEFFVSLQIDIFMLMNQFVRLSAYLIFAAIAPAAVGATVDVSGSSARAVIRCEAPANSGLAAVFVAPDPSGLSATYTSDGGSVTWQQFSNLGGGYAEPVNPANISSSGSVWTLSNLEPDMGYIATENGRQTCFWVINYAANPLELNGLEATEADCGSVTLHLDGKAKPLHYFSVNGRQMELSRELKLSYSTLQFDQEAFVYSQAPVDETIASVADSGNLHPMAPLCATDFTLQGDRFLTQWGAPESVTSASASPIAVEAHTRAVQQETEADNISGGSEADETLGGSAPATIDFEAVVSDAVIFTEWQFSRHPEFEDIDLRINQLSYTHVFDEEGTTYVRFVADNQEGSCQFISDTYEVSIGVSSLLCPNAFSPGASEGVNDVWKVSYASIVEFDCHIFNRAGQQMCAFSNPAEGWDGKYKGKLVPAGVYYYVITARGADGKKYNLSGDINIISYK